MYKKVQKVILKDVFFPLVGQLPNKLVRWECSALPLSCFDQFRVKVTVMGRENKLKLAWEAKQMEERKCPRGVGQVEVASYPYSDVL